MKLLDANVFLRYLTNPKTSEDVRKNALATGLFVGLDSSSEKVTSCEAVIHEVFYVLCSRSQYGLDHATAARLMRRILSRPAFYLPRKRLFLRAIDLFARYTFLDYSDALQIVYSEVDRHNLVSFDEQWDRVPGVQRFEP